MRDPHGISRHMPPHPVPSHFTSFHGARACEVSPLALQKSKRWLARHRITWDAPDRCAARECVQERWRAAHEEEISSARRSHRHCFFCTVFPVPPCSQFCPRHAPGFVSRPNWLTTVNRLRCRFSLSMGKATHQHPAGLLAAGASKLARFLARFWRRADAPNWRKLRRAFFSWA